MKQMGQSKDITDEREKGKGERKEKKRHSMTCFSKS